MIKKLNNKDQQIARQMQMVFQCSYQIEALILQADEFPPLKRTLEQYINTDTEFYGFWQDKRLAAVIELRFIPQSIHIQSLVVDPDFFRQGIASKLLNLVLTSFETPLFTVETGAANVPAIKLYEKFGFKQSRQYVAGQGITKICFEKKESISLLGCGWMGFPIAQYLVEKGYLIKGSTTHQQKIAQLIQAEISAFIINLQNLTDETEDFLKSDILIIAIAYKNINDFKKLITFIEKSPVKKVMFISSTSVYPSHNSIVDETTKTITKPLTQIEDLFRSNENFKSIILRCSGLFGYDRKPGNFIQESMPVKNPEGFVNMIHRDDCIAIIEQIIVQNIWEDIFNACADEHPRRRDYYEQETKKLGLPPPIFEKCSKNVYKIVSNKKLKKRLVYRFKYSKLMGY